MVEPMTGLVTPDRLVGLPEPVQRYMAYTGVVGKPWIETVHLKQVGRFRLGLDKPWMPMCAEQYFTTNPPGFVWLARFKLAGLPLLSARDEYRDGHGHMYGKIAGLLTLFDLRGDELDQGTMLRYLSEMIWFPTAFLGENITWQAVDEQSALVTFTDGGRSVSGQMFFDALGRPTHMTAQRYREQNGRFSLDPWTPRSTAYALRAGLNLPVKNDVTWNLPSGYLTYADLEIIEIAYNQSGDVR